MEPQTETSQATKVCGVMGDDLAVAPHQRTGRDEQVDIGNLEAVPPKTLVHLRRKLGRFALEWQDPKPLADAVDPSKRRSGIWSASNSPIQFEVDVRLDEEVAPLPNELIDNAYRRRPLVHELDQDVRVDRRRLERPLGPSAKPRWRSS